LKIYTKVLEVGRVEREGQRHVSGYDCKILTILTFSSLVQFDEVEV